MKHSRLLICALLAAIPASAVAERQQLPDIKPIELSGRLRRPVKWTPQLEIIPAGQISRIDLEGGLIGDIKDGTPVKVWGVVRSQLHRGGTASNPSPFPAQWIIWLEVTRLEPLDDPTSILR